LGGRAKEKPKKLARSVALAGRPRRLPFLRRQETDDGRTRVTVRLRRAGWTRWLGGSEQIERIFVLDALGREVYDACDGKSSVKRIVRAFAERHDISIAEAEISVTTFLRTMMNKGLVAIVIDQDQT